MKITVFINWLLSVYMELTRQKAVILNTKFSLRGFPLRSNTSSFYAATDETIISGMFVSFNNILLLKP